MNIYVITQDADYEEYEGFTVAAEDEAGIEQAIRDYVAKWHAYDFVDGEMVPSTDASEIDRRMRDLWPTAEQLPEWRKTQNRKPRKVRLIGFTAPDITEPGVLLSAFRAG